MRKYRLPDETYTEDPDEYDEAYDKLAEEVLKYFPGFTFGGVSHNYGLTLEYREIYAGNKMQCFHRFILPLEACWSLLRKKEPERIKRFDL